MRASPLARILFALYVALVAYASLYPLEGWRDHGIAPFAYLAGPWPRYVTAFDVSANVLGYVPYGLLCVAALYPRVRGAAAFAVATLSGLGLSLVLEAGQTFLPARIENILDLVCNVAGAALGAALALPFLPRVLEEGPLRRLRSNAFLAGTGTDVGLVLIGVWVFIQLNPATLLFGAGDLRDLLAVPGGPPRGPGFFAAIEAATTAANLVAVGLLGSVLIRPGLAVRRMFVALVIAALAVKTAAFAIVMRAEHVLAWLTPGAQMGLLAGLAIALAAVALPRTARLAAAAILLMAATALVNLAPTNPYFAATLAVWRQGHFLNFNGLTRLLTALWPFVAIGYLIVLAARRREPLG